MSRQDVLFLTMVLVVASLLAVGGLVWLDEGDEVPIPPAPLVEESGIEIEPPGSKAAAVTTVEGTSYLWLVLGFRGAVAIIPFRAGEDGRRITWEAVKGTTYVIDLVVQSDEGLSRHNQQWKYGEPEPPDPPPPDPGLEGLALEAFNWAQPLSTDAKQQGQAFGKIFQTVATNLDSGSYTPEGDWGEQITNAHQDLAARAKQQFIATEWSTNWVPKYNQRMSELWPTFNNRNDVAAAMRQVAKGLLEVKATPPIRSPKFMPTAAILRPLSRDAPKLNWSWVSE